jgi:hypothetical protein
MTLFKIPYADTANSPLPQSTNILTAVGHRSRSTRVTAAAELLSPNAEEMALLFVDDSVP